jgi:FAD/FMN-containing dehydrogenase
MHDVTSTTTRGLAAELVDRVRGPVLAPGDEGFDAGRAGFQTAAQHSPAVIVAAAGEADVGVAVDLAVRHGLPVAVQATGHGLTSALDGGVLVNTARMRGVRVDAGRGSARIEAGARWEGVIRAAAVHGLAPLSGTAPGVGAVSYVLGGGLPLLGRCYGYAADHVRSLDLVTADARRVHVTARTAADLFWALRGAGANFGVVTALEIDLVPVTRLYGGSLTFDIDPPGRVLHAWREWTTALPDEMASSVALLRVPDVPSVPAAIRGRVATIVRIAYAGRAAEGERLVAPLRAVGPCIRDTVAELPFTASASIYEDPTTPRASYGTNLMLRELTAGTIDALLAATGPADGPTPVIRLLHLGGALGRPPATPNAVGHRDARYLLWLVTPLVGDGAGTAAARDTHDRLAAACAPWGTGGVSPNFVFGAATTPDRVRSMYDAGALPRLAALKALHDPANTFRINHNIPPPGGDQC